jgi:AcrR family transcriptional regulator
MLDGVEARIVGAAVSTSPTPPRRKRGRPRNPEADGRILAAASSLILLRGFEVYRRWSRKEDLAVAAMEQLYRDEMPTPDTGSIREDLRGMYAAVLGFVNSSAGTDYVRTTIKESMRDERIATLYREANARAEQGTAQVFQRAIERGEVRADVPIETVVQFLGSLVSMRAVTGQEMPSPEELDGLVEFVLHGVAS